VSADAPDIKDSILMKEERTLGKVVRAPDGNAGRLQKIVADTSEHQHPYRNSQVLMIHGTILLQRPHRWVEVKRGMLVRSSEGMVVGQVAALVVDDEGQQVIHFLLTRLSSELDYRLVPVELVRDLPVETLLLSISSADVRHLPRWSGSGVSISSDNNQYG
jgi:hypothetical protein